METSDYDKFLRQLIALKPGVFAPGQTTLFTWQSREHMEEWYRLQTESHEARILGVPSAMLPMLHTEATLDYAVISVAALATSQRADLSDTRCLYWLPIESSK